MGERPALNSCYRGAQFADCGGQGAPRFGCPLEPALGGGVDGCRWFTGGCVAAEYFAWPCGNADICCDDGAGPAFPAAYALYAPAFFAANGSSPWTRERALAVSVVVEPELTGELSVTCQRDGALVEDIYPCRVPGTGTTEFMNRYRVHATMRDTLSASVLQSDGFVGRSLMVEIMPAERLARVCLLSTSDAVPLSCEPEDYRDGDCATAGLLRVSRLPERDATVLSGVILTGSVSFANGLDIAFNVPL